MKKLESKRVIVVDYQRKKYLSSVGNPSYKLFMQDLETGEYLRGETITNGACGYESFDTLKYKQIPIVIKFHYTRKTNKLIIDFIERA